MYWRLSVAVLLTAVLVVGCGGGDEVTAPPNEVPTIQFTFTKIGVARLIPVDLTVSVSDEDADDVLSVSWSITRGQLSPQNAANTVMRWTPPATLGVDTVTISVSDGKISQSVTATIVVGTRAGGIIAKNEYLKSESPYILVGDGTPPIVSVDPNQTSVIQAGVEILIDRPETAFDVYGRLESNGTDLDHVIIRPNDRTLTCGENRGWWKGFRGFSDPPTATDGDINLIYTNVWYANNAVFLTDGSSAAITGSFIRCSGDDGVRMESSGSLSLLESEVTDGRNNGVTVESIAVLPAGVSITNSNVSINNGIGLELDLLDTSAVVPIAITDNVIEFNNLSGITLSNAVFPDIHGNTFAANGAEGVLRNIQLSDGYPGGASVDTLDASLNYYGVPVSNQSSIDATIRDSLDSGAVGTRVKTWPWCNDAACTIIAP